jgi:hypothetical protein
MITRLVHRPRPAGRCRPAAPHPARVAGSPQIHSRPGDPTPAQSRCLITLPKPAARSGPAGPNWRAPRRIASISPARHRHPQHQQRRGRKKHDPTQAWSCFITMPQSQCTGDAGISPKRSVDGQHTELSAGQMEKRLHGFPFGGVARLKALLGPKIDAKRKSYKRGRDWSPEAANIGIGGGLTEADFDWSAELPTSSELVADQPDVPRVLDALPDG